MFRHYQREISVAVVYAALLLLLGKSSFYKSSEPVAILVQNAPVLVAAVGMTVVILARHIDVSIGAQFSLCAVTSGLLAQAGVPVPFAVLVILVIGAGLGGLNAGLIVGLRLPSIVVTVATMAIIRESLRWWREGEFVRKLPAGFQWFGAGQGTGRIIVIGIALAIFTLFAWGMRYLAAGRAVYATGSNAEAARLAGIRTIRVIFAVFVVMGMLTAIAAQLSAVRLPQVDPKEGEGLELQVIAAVVLGGVAITGGRGTLIGSFLGVALLGTIRSALVFLGAQAHWEKAIQGAIILVAVASDSLAFKNRIISRRT